MVCISYFFSFFFCLTSLCHRYEKIFLEANTELIMMHLIASTTHCEKRWNTKIKKFIIYLIITTFSPSVPFLRHHIFVYCSNRTMIGKQ